MAFLPDLIAGLGWFEAHPGRVAWWVWLLLAIGAAVVIWTLFVVSLVLADRRGESRAFAAFIPDCLVLVGRLLAEPRVSRRRKLLFVALLGYLALPFNVVPDFVPRAGQLDDVIVVAIVLRRFLKSGGEPLVLEHWPGPEQSLRFILRTAGRAV